MVQDSHYCNVARKYPIQDINLVQTGPNVHGAGPLTKMVSSTDLARMVYFFRGIADPDAIDKSVFSDNYSLVIRRSIRNRSSHLEAWAS
jgi:hypothetical protein